MKIHLIGRKPALLLALLLAIVVPVVAYDAEASEVFKVTILHMNDPHAHYEPFRITAKGEPIGGFGKAQTVMASVREECKKEGRHVLTLLAGDLLMGTPYSTVFKGRLGVRLMNDMNFDAMAVGNHEFDYGKTHLLETLRPLARFPLLSANISTDKGERVFEKSIVKEYPGSKTRAIIFGLTTEDTPKITMPDYVKGLVFHDPVKAARELCSELDHGDLVIALTHLGVEADRALAQACPKIDVVIGGHTHTAIPEPEKLGDTLICQAGAYAQYVGRLDVNLVNGKIVNHSGRLISLGPEVEEAPGIASVVADYRRQLDA
ncbi:MAG: metallophosphatase, partial [Deltaproteobacteria bacterium]|nr:metallophosphatase [Deltaproteobacteria bacterium]